jgi:hypothetical protein
MDRWIFCCCRSISIQEINEILLQFGSISIMSFEVIPNFRHAYTNPPAILVCNCNDVIGNVIVAHSEDGTLPFYGGKLLNYFISSYKLLLLNTMKAIWEYTTTYVIYAILTRKQIELLSNCDIA